jgi:hypothetical protein
VTLAPHEAAQHAHVIGVTGSGKSRFLAGLFLELLHAGCAATLIDPHGDLARLVLGHLIARGFFDDSTAYDRLLYLDVPAAERSGRFMPYNVLAQRGAADVVAANVMEAMHRTWPALSGGAAPRFDSFVQYGVPVLLSNDLPLPALAKLIAEKPFRDACLESEPDPDVQEFWQGWYDALPERVRLDYADSTLSRIRLLTRSPVLRYSLSARDNLLDWRGVFDAGRSVIINLALPNSEAQRLLGCLLMVGAEHGAMSRAELPPGVRGRNHHLIVDEFPEFTARSEEAAARMLSQTRKYGLFLILAHQNWTQTSERLRGALQNVKLEVSFALGREDAERSAKLLGRVDTERVKHEAADATRGHPLFDPLAEQWEKLTQSLMDQVTGRAVVRLPPANRPWWKVWRRQLPRTLTIATLPVPDPAVSAEAIAAVESVYRARYFTPAATRIEDHRPVRQAARSDRPRRVQTDS